MNPTNKPDQRGFKPGANMPQEGYDPKTEGMSQSGNHATGNPANDTPAANQQSAADAATAATHRDKKAGARGDDYSDSNRTDNRSGKREEK